jgi:triosephosphate isomerase (TIM)
MYKGLRLRPPLFEIGLKGYIYGKEALELAREADRLSEKYNIGIIFDPQYVDIPIIARETNNIYVFSQHMDPLKPGRGLGGILPEALKEAGAAGTLLNHAEKRLTLSHISRAIDRADEVGLATLVCADTPEEAAAIALLRPNMILAEPPDLIGADKAVGKEFIQQTKKLVKSIDPDIIIFNSAGIKNAGDVRNVIMQGAEATGSTSGILKAEDPFRMMEEMISAFREAWDEKYPGKI